MRAHTAIKDMGIGWEDYEKNLDGLVDRVMKAMCAITNLPVLDMEEYKKLFIYAYEGKKVGF